MFQFGGLTFLAEYNAFSVIGFPIRKSPDQRLLAPPRSLSQLVTSFIVSESQGILHTLLITFLFRCLSFSRLIYNYCIFFQYVKEHFHLSVNSSEQQLNLYKPFWGFALNRAILIN